MARITRVKMLDLKFVFFLGEYCNLICLMGRGWTLRVRKTCFSGMHLWKILKFIELI